MDEQQVEFSIERTKRTDHPPEPVMDRVLAPATWPEWQSEILSTTGPERVAEGDVVRGRAELLGFKVEGISTAVEVSPSRFVEDVVIGVRMRVSYETATAEGGANVTHRLEMELPKGPAGRVLAFFLRRRLRRMQVTLLDELARQAGEDSAR